jgi:multiple sugar transport system ATP-binding protein
MDEPLSNLDAKLRGHMRAHLKHMQKSMGITTIYVTHDQIEAMTLAHRVAILEKGVLQQLATPAEIYNNPANLFVAQFIGSPPMNVVHGSLNGGQFVTNGVAIQTAVTGQADQAIMGVRPEDCSIASSGEGTLSGKIFTNELIGDHALVTLDWGDDQISVKAPKDFAGEQGDEVGVIIHPDCLFVFDESNGQRIR